MTPPNDRQPSLFRTRPPRVREQDIAWMIRALTGRGWLSAFILASGSERYSDRDVRAIAAASEGRIISGQKGYALIEEATVEEANHAAAWLEHQAAAMSKRAREIRQAMHKRSAA